MIHVARTRRCEIVVFGRGQKLLTPVVLGTGSILLNAADGDEKVQISKIVPSQFGDGDQKVAGVPRTRRRAPPGGQPRRELPGDRRHPPGRRAVRRTSPAPWSSTPSPALSSDLHRRRRPGEGRDRQERRGPPEDQAGAEAQAKSLFNLPPTRVRPARSDVACLGAGSS